MYDRTPRTLSLSLTCLNIPTDKTYLNILCSSIYIWVISSPWRDPWTPHLASPPGICLPLALYWPYPLITGMTQNEWLWILFLRPQLVGEAFLSLWGCHGICPLLNVFHITSITHSEVSSLTSLKAWEAAEKFCSNVAFLLVLIEEGSVGDRVYGLSMIWVNPYQAWVSTMEEAVKQLTA